MSRTGAGRSSTVSMTLKIAVLAPIPSAIVSSATHGEPGVADEHPDGVAKVLTPT